MSTSGRFRIGSVTKTFVATVVLQLADEGRLALDDPIARHLPDTVPGGEAITVRQLLNHTSGIYDYAHEPDRSTNRWRGEARFRTYRRQQYDLPCGATVFGHGGELLGFLTYAMASADGGRQLALSYNPLRSLEGTSETVIGLFANGFCPRTAGGPSTEEGGSVDGP